MITVYSKDNCVKCDKLIAFLYSKNIPHRVLKLEKDFKREDLVDIFSKLELPLPRAFPVVFRYLEYIGSLAEVVKLVNNGDLVYE